MIRFSMSLRKPVGKLLPSMHTLLKLERSSTMRCGQLRRRISVWKIFFRKTLRVPSSTNAAWVKLSICLQIFGCISTAIRRIFWVVLTNIVFRSLLRPKENWQVNFILRLVSLRHWWTYYNLIKAVFTILAAVRVVCLYSLHNSSRATPEISIIYRSMVRIPILRHGKWRRWTWRFAVSRPISDNIMRIPFSMIAIQLWRPISWWPIHRSIWAIGGRISWRMMCVGNTVRRPTAMPTLRGFSISSTTLPRRDVRALCWPTARCRARVAVRARFGVNW